SSPPPEGVPARAMSAHGCARAAAHPWPRRTQRAYRCSARRSSGRKLCRRHPRRESECGEARGMPSPDTRAGDFYRSGAWVSVEGCVAQHTACARLMLYAPAGNDGRLTTDVTTANGASRPRRAACAKARSLVPGLMKGGALVLAVALSAACATELEDPARFTGSALGAGGSAGGVTGSGGTTGAGGSAGTAGSGGSGPDTATCWLNIVRTQCLICHASAATPGKIDLSGTGPQIAARLRDVPPTNDAVADPESCLPGEKLIDP